METSTPGVSEQVVEMINTKPSRAVEKAWLDRVGAHGCVITRNSEVQIHHCLGREAKSNKYHIGRFFVLPLEYDLHDYHGKSRFNVTNHRKAFVEAYGRECDRFRIMCQALELNAPLPFDDNVMVAIIATRR